MKSHTARRGLCALGVTFAVSLALTGCSENQQSIYRETNLASGNSPITDAKQRIVVNRDIELDSDGRIKPKKIVCVEPSPDVSQAISEAIKASASADLSKMTPTGATPGEKSLSLGFERSVAAQVAQLGERLAAIQLLRDKMYRACEAYANGAVGPIAYTLMQARLDKTMTTLLSSEMAAGAFGRALAAANGSASTSGVDPKALKDAEKEVMNAKDAFIAAKDETAKSEAGKKLNEAVAALTSLERLSGGTGAGGAGGVSLPGSIATHPGAAGAGFVAQIHRGYIDDDGLEPLVDACITAMERVQVKPYELRNAYTATSGLQRTNVDVARNNLRSAQEAKERAEVELERRLKEREALRAIRNPTDDQRMQAAELDAYGIPRARRAVAANDLNVNAQMEALKISQPQPALDYDKQIIGTYLSAGEPFAAFCYNAVFTKDAPFVKTRQDTKKELRTTDAQKPLRDLKGDICMTLLQDDGIRGAIAGDPAKATVAAKTSLKTYCNIELK